MKLIRLTTQDPLSMFDATFNDDLIIPVGTKIALQSLSIDTVNSVLVVDANNDTFEFQVSNGYARQFKILHREFDKNNYQTLFREIRDQLNENTGFLQNIPEFDNQRELGLQWRCDTNQENQVEIEYKRGISKSHVNATYKDNWIFGLDADYVTTSNGSFRPSATSTYGSTNEKCCLFKFPIAKGCGFYRNRLLELTDPPVGTIAKDNGVFIGLTTQNVNEIEPIGFDDTMLSYGFHIAIISTTGTPALYQVRDGVRTLVNYVPRAGADGDFFEVIKTFDKIVLNYYEGNNNQANTVAEFPYTANTDLYPFTMFRGPNAKTNFIRTTANPYATIPDAPNTGDLEVGIPPQQAQQPGANFINIPVSVSSFLGYNNPRNPATSFLQVAEALYTAENIFEPKDIADSFIVQALNLKLESYDSLKQQRQNILAVVPKSNKDGEVIYEVNTPLFIDLNNSAPLLLRNLRFRLVKPDFSELAMKGQASMVILLE